MASRLLAKKYLRSIGGPVPKTEPECVATVILEHATFRELATRDAQRVARRSWFGRLLWKLFGRWL